MTPKTEKFEVVVFDLLTEKISDCWSENFYTKEAAITSKELMPKLVVGLEYRILKTTTELV